MSDSPELAAYKAQQAKRQAFRNFLGQLQKGDAAEAARIQENWRPALEALREAYDDDYGV